MALQSTNRTSFSPGRSGKNLFVETSPKHEELKLLLSKANSTDVFTTDRFPRPKPFFQQAYLAKSKIETLSRTSKIRRSKSNKPSHLPAQPSKLPHIKPGRFNEDTVSEYSAMGRKKPQVKRLALPNQQFVSVGQKVERPRVDGSHLSQVSHRADEMKRMLIDTIEMMDDREVEVMKSAIESVKQSSRNKVTIDKCIRFFCITAYQNSLFNCF